MNTYPLLNMSRYGNSFCAAIAYPTWLNLLLPSRHHILPTSLSLPMHVSYRWYRRTFLFALWPDQGESRCTCCLEHTGSLNLRWCLSPILVYNPRFSILKENGQNYLLQFWSVTDSVWRVLLPSWLALQLERRNKKIHRSIFGSIDTKPTRLSENNTG